MQRIWGELVKLEQIISFFIQNNLDIHVNCSWITIVYQNLTKCIVISLRVNFPVSKKVLEKKTQFIYFLIEINVRLLISVLR